MRALEVSEISAFGLTGNVGSGWGALLEVDVAAGASGAGSTFSAT